MKTWNRLLIKKLAGSFIVSAAIITISLMLLFSEHRNPVKQKEVIYRGDNTEALYLHQQDVDRIAEFINHDHEQYKRAVILLLTVLVLIALAQTVNEFVTNKYVKKIPDVMREVDKCKDEIKELIERLKEFNS